MFELSQFYNYCDQRLIDIIVYTGAPSPGLTIRDGSYYAIFLDFSQIRSTRLLKGICCHEMGHEATGALHKVSSRFDLVERSEYRANRWVAEHILTADQFREAIAAGYAEPWQLADYFDLPQQDVMRAYEYWTQRRGIDLSPDSE